MLENFDFNVKKQDIGCSMGNESENIIMYDNGDGLGCLDRLLYQKCQKYHPTDL